MGECVGQLVLFHANHESVMLWLALVGPFILIIAMKLLGLFWAGMKFIVKLDGTVPFLFVYNSISFSTI